MESNSENYTWYELTPEAAARLKEASKNFTTIAPSDGSDQLRKDPWYNTSKINLTISISSTPDLKGVAVELSPSTNRRAITGHFFNGLAAMSGGDQSIEKPSEYAFKLFKARLGLPLETVNNWEELGSFLMNDQGMDNFQRLALPDTMGLEAIKKEFKETYPAIILSHPDELIPSVPATSIPCDISGTGIGMWVYTSSDKCYQLLNHNNAVRFVVTQAISFFSLPADTVGLYFGWLPHKEYLAGGRIWGQFLVYEQKPADT